jgi:hypothetical protein
MAKNPGNTGLGTGTAVVHDYSTVNNAMDNFFRVVNAKDAASAKQRQVDEAKREKALAELRGEVGEFDRSKMREPDKEAALKMANDIRLRYNGKWGDILNGDPEVSNSYHEEIGKLQNFISNSVGSKQKMVDLYKSSLEPDSGYSDERKKQIEDYYTQEGMTYDRMVEDGIVGPDTVIGDPLGRIDEAFGKDTDVLYDKKDTTFRGEDGTESVRESKIWKSDEEAFPAFKKTIGANERIMSDMNLMFPGMPVDEQYQALYDQYKTSREDKDIKTKYMKATPDNSGSGSGGGSKFNYDLTRGVKMNLKGKKGMYDVITVGKSSGAKLPPTKITYKNQSGFGVPSEIVKGKDGKIWVNMIMVESWGPGSAKEGDEGENYTLSGESKLVPVGKVLKSQFRSTYGVDVDEYFRSGGGDMSKAGAKYN